MHVKWFIMVGLLLAGMKMSAQQIISDFKTAKIVTENTAKAFVSEELYRLQNDTVKSNTLNILSAVTLRNSIYTMDMLERTNRAGFKRESKAYYRLVYEVNYFMESATALLKEASKNPHHMVFCTTQTAKLMLEAKNLVKYAVVVAMNGKVPNPFKINPDSLEKDIATVPNYIDDPDRDTLVTDGLNLLLPDDRYEILTETRLRLRAMRRAMDKMYWKLKTDFNVRNLIWAASRVDGRLYDRNVYAIEELKSNLQKAGGLW